MATAFQAELPRSVTMRTLPVRILLANIPWELYERLLGEEVNRGVRMAFCDGELELMSPSQSHGEIKWRFGLFLMELARALGFKCKPIGNTTWQKSGVSRAKEADGAYYLVNFDIHLRQSDGSYHEADQSRALPFSPLGRSGLLDEESRGRRRRSGVGSTGR